MFTDMVGYTALTQTNEARTLEILEKHNKLLRSIFPRFNGREVKTVGDSFLVEFESALDAANCALEIQRSVHDYNASSKDEWKITLRIGIHLGDVIHVRGDILGDAVNIASRLQPLAEPGGICVSDQVFGQVRNKIPQTLMKLEPQDLKGVRFPVDVYKMTMPWEKEHTESVEELDLRRVAVLPFSSMSPDPNDEYFADGLTEELIDRLAQVRELGVIARTSVMNYKRKEKNASQIGRELKAGALVEGSVRKAGNRIRVTAQLINSNNEEHLWSSHYDGNLDDIFAVQSDIAERVAGELKVKLLTSEKETLEKKYTDSMEAYSNFLRARELYREGSEQKVRDALKLFERAVELDPSFARAYVGLAECHQLLVNGGYEARDVAFPALKASLKRSLELEPDLAEAHASLAMMYLHEDDLARQEEEAKRALQLNPSLPGPYYMLFDVESIKGNVKEMVWNAESAYRLDPILPNYILLMGRVYLWTGRDQEALDHWKRTEHLAPAVTYRNMTDYYLSKGDIEKAREMHARFEKLNPSHPWVTYMGGFIEAASGNREKAMEAIRKIQERNMGDTSYNWVAYVYYALGDIDRYFENLNRALEKHAIVATVVMYSPLLARGREDPRYQELVERLRKMVGLTN